VTRGRSVLLLAVASVVAAALSGQASAATRECEGLQVCVQVPGPWVAVPVGSGAPRPRVEFQLSCPEGHVVGGIDVEVSDPAIDVAFLGKSGSPVNPGITTARAAVFVATYVGASSSAPSFRPHLGCIPGGGGDRVPTALVAVFPVGTPTVRRVTDVRLRPQRTSTITRRCARSEQLVGGSHAIGFFTARPPDPALVGMVTARLLMSRDAAAAVVRTGALGSARVIVQVGAVCAKGV
jgi:hypothetical protein